MFTTSLFLGVSFVSMITTGVFGEYNSSSRNMSDSFFVGIFWMGLALEKEASRSEARESADDYQRALQ